MKKLFFVDKIGLKIESGNLNILLLLFLLNENILPQIPINGFCKYNSYTVDSGYTKLLMTNFNGDAYSDLLLYSPAKKEVVSLEGAFKGEFVKNKKFSIPHEINFLHPLNSKSSTRFVFTNRKKRQAGFFELNANGKPKLTREVNFDYYPEFINTADINSDGKNEILLSGGAFNGISILYQTKSELSERNILKGTYSQAAFIEINNDEFVDFAGYDLLTYSFSFFYNNSQGDFRKARSIYFPEKPAGIKSFDINLDSYEDLIFSTGNSINIWYGDFRSSYDSKNRIVTSYKPDKYIYGDFNKDGFIDFAYLNIYHSSISLLFAKNEIDYYPEIIYLIQEGLRDIIPYYSRFIDGIAALSINGELYTITNLSSFTEDVNISIGAKPNALAFFDNENNGITDFCFIDEYDKKIKFILRDITGIPALYFSQQLFENHEKVLAENLKAGEKNYICFSYNKKLIEVVKTNFSNNSISKTALYSPGSILDLKIRRESSDDYKIYILYKIKEALNVGVFDYQNFKFNFQSRQIAGVNNLLDASLGLSSGLNINYLNVGQEKISFHNYKSDKVFNYNNKISVIENHISSVTSFTGDLLNMEKSFCINFIAGEAENLLIVLIDTSITIIKEDEKQGFFRITSKKNLFFRETRFNGLKKLCAYNPEKKIVSRLEFIRRGKNIVFTKLADINNPGSYFIKNMTSKNYHIVYSDLEKKCITIKRLKG